MHVCKRISRSWLLPQLVKQAWACWASDLNINGIHLLEAIESSATWMHHIVALFETFQSTPLQR
jgi:hypothetical protein